MSNLEKHFSLFRNHVVGIDQIITTPYGAKKMIYADWIASGRLYQPIEERMLHDIGPYVANTHTETTETGTLMTKAYQYAHKKIKQHVNADENDVILTQGFGMTAVVNKFQRILGLNVVQPMKMAIAIRRGTNQLCLSPIWNIIPTKPPGLKPLLMLFY